MADVAQIRKRVRTAIEHQRKAAAERRERSTRAAHAYEAFLESVATPAFRQLANVLRAEGIPFDVQTPSGSVILVSDRSRDDRIELALDPTSDPPSPMLTVSRGRGSRLVRREQAVKEHAAIESITEDELIERLLDELKPWFE